MSAPNPWLGRPRPPRRPDDPDPDALRVVGPRRRAAVARAVNEVVAGVDVHGYAYGWTVSTITGYYALCHTLGALLDAVARPEERDLLRATLLDAADRSAGAP